MYLFIMCSNCMRVIMCTHHWCAHHCVCAHTCMCVHVCARVCTCVCVLCGTCLCLSAFLSGCACVEGGEYSAFRCFLLYFLRESDVCVWCVHARTYVCALGHIT
eukprot:GDKI01027443.1.p2 GENE.GDKI01027443.1~~GDKI01027443.1.p2  ORF type:complete len:104 (+),score=26.43 GDKI01027443.1:71-382(+)